MNSTKLHHHYFDELLQFPEISGNCRMPRLKGSANKRIHISSVDELNIQSIYDKVKLDSSELEPDHWFYRLQRISGNMPYIIWLKQDIEKGKFVFSEYIDADLNVLKEKSYLIELTKPGSRLNDCLVEEIDDFMIAIFNWFVKLYGIKTESSHLKLIAMYNQLLTISRKSLSDLNSGKIKKRFLLHKKQASILNVVIPDIEINSTADVEILKRWYHGWFVFWHVMINKLEEQKLFFARPSFKLKDGIPKNNKNFHKWVETGLINFLEPQNVKLQDVDLAIRYLKLVILNNKR